MRHSMVVLALRYFCFLIFAVGNGKGSVGQEMGSDPRVKPGASFVEQFPELGPAMSADKTEAEIYIPTDYSLDRKFPLLVYFWEANGDSSVAEAKDITNGKRFVCAALPYKLMLDENGKRIERAHNIPWPYFQTILARVEALVPNINPRKRACVGYSRGGQVITWEIGHTSGTFAEYFSVFMPGGVVDSSSSWAGLDKAKGKKEAPKSILS